VDSLSDVTTCKKGNREYICFDADSSKRLLQLRIDATKIQQQIQELEKLVSNKEQEISLLLSTSKGLSEELEKSKVKMAELSKLECPHRWVGWIVSFVVGALLTAGGVLYLEKNK
jgi:23S rRNA pseudoU1915 N3-methylase RlmH